MKKFLLPLLAVMFAATTAFSVQSSKATVADDPVYHWFDENGQYIDELPLSTMQTVCPGNGDLCATAYEQVQEQNGQIVPVGSSAAIVRKP